MLLRDPLPVEREAALQGELPNEFPLVTAVAFTEWMNGVDLAEIVGAAPREGFGI